MTFIPVDDEGRVLGHEQTLPDDRPMGPWSTNFKTPKPRVVCAWCPDFDPTDPANKNASHGLCADCKIRMEGRTKRA
jgi:hypothetical protein